jgi:mannitol-1-phosphate 5-dehydrogenase
VHAWLGYIAESERLLLMSEIGQRDDLMRRALEVFQKEVGPGLIHAHKGSGDPLFTEEGILLYAKDALKRMVNPFLNDPIERVTRDPIRKLGWEDRLIGAMRLAMDAGVKPLLLAEGARIALQRAAKDASLAPKDLLKKIWSQGAPKEEMNQIAKLLID